MLCEVKLMTVLQPTGYYTTVDYFKILAGVDGIANIS
jgi:hypothetical protein